MSVIHSLKGRAIAGLGVFLAVAVVLISMSATAVAQQTAPPTGWPVLQMANPAPGTLISNGDYVISGTAFDPAANLGSGISRVDLFLGPRDEGGTFLGSTVPGQDVMQGLTPGSTIAQDSFQVTVTVPSGMSGGKDFFAYAYSSVTGAVTAVSMPIYVAAVPTDIPTPVTAPVEQVEHLFAPTGGIPAPVTAPVAQVEQLFAPTGGSAAYFSLGNPSPGDVVLNGNYVVSGATGSEFDRVTVFLDDRDAGGFGLGTTTPINGKFTLTVTIPTSTAGGHSFTAYAYSSATGQESKVSVPIYIGAPPTPTPHPS